MAIPTLTLNNAVEIPAFGLGVYRASAEETTGAVGLISELRRSLDLAL